MTWDSDFPLERFAKPSEVVTRHPGSPAKPGLRRFPDLAPTGWYRAGSHRPKLFSANSGAKKCTATFCAERSR